VLQRFPLIAPGIGIDTVRAIPWRCALYPRRTILSIRILMYLPKVYDSQARDYRVRYAIANILRDRVVNEGAFNTCFEMDDADQVICAILRRGLRNPKLRIALERSHLVNLAQWLAPRPEFWEAYHATETDRLARKLSSVRRRRVQRLSSKGVPAE
jgi:hypothetical protein